MRILVLGGTRFLGRAIVDAALGRGDTVTLFNRGQSNPGLYPGVETVTGDRTADLSALDGREWDAVIDVAAYDPAVARLSAETFAKRTGRYVFVSTVSVYASQQTTAAQLEDAPVAELRDGMEFPESYGPNKALCERAVQDVYGDRALIGRPGLITGPNDPTDRVPYWPRRIARGGRVLAPGDPADLVQFIDARDLGAWFADACHAGRGGVYNLTGAPVSFGIMLDLCKTAAYSDAELTWIPADAAGRRRRRSGDGHPAVDRRARLRGLQRRGQLAGGRRRAGVPAGHRDRPRHPRLGPGARRPGRRGPVRRRGGAAAPRAGPRVVTATTAMAVPASAPLPGWSLPESPRTLRAARLSFPPSLPSLVTETHFVRKNGRALAGIFSGNWSG